MGSIGFGGMMLGPDVATASGGGSAPPTSPVTGYTLWLKATNYTAGTWTDSSGNGYNFINGVGGSRNPTAGTSINGNATVNFVSANSQYLYDTSINIGNLISAANFSVFCVFQYTGTTSFTSGYSFFNPVLLMDSSQEWGFQGGIASSSLSVQGYVNGASGSGPLSTGTSQSIPYYASFVQSSAGSSLQLTLSANSVISVTNHNVPATSGNPYIGENGGGGGYWDGYVGEIIIYNTALSSGNQSTNMSYLKNKFGL